VRKESGADATAGAPVTAPADPAPLPDTPVAAE
jgi:hypothetical protein